MLPRPNGVVTLLTDYGLRDPYVGILKGAMLRSSPKVQWVDICHDVPAHDLATGSFLLHTLIGRFPSGTVHLAVVDPGVGTARRLLAVAAHDCYWLAPDNGLLAPMLAGDAAIDVRAIDVEHLGLHAESRTFHGRDLLGPVAAWLAAGRYGFSALGPRVHDPVRTEDLFAGAQRVVHVDRFGNLVTNVEATAFAGARGLRIAGRDLPQHATYGEVAPGELLAYVGSFGLVEVARNGGSAAALLEVGRGASVELLPA
jgi:S-adenosyl-L-methionine hydrolase (adenosine-forming)